MRESIFSSAIRAFFVTVFVVIGFFAALIPIFIFIGALGDTPATPDPERTYKPQIVANADNIRKTMPKDTPVILKLNLDGIIGMDSLSTRSIRQQLIESREGDLKKDRVKGILLFVNSPGGTVVDSDGIYEAIQAYKKQYSVPVFAYVDGMCASGGMYVAAAADKINSSDASLIGSVGVLSPSFLNFTKLIDKIGVEALTIYAGKDKDLMNPLRPWNESEPKIVQNLIDFYYQRFVDIIVGNRKIDREKLIQDYGAKIFNPKEAQEKGFIDASGSSYNATLKELLQHIGITDDKYQVIELKKKDWWSELFTAESMLLTGKVKHTIETTPDMDLGLMNKYLYLYRP